MSTQSITSHRVKIERVVTRGPGGACAEFLLNGEWFCCRAWIAIWGQRIQVRGTEMLPEQASAVAIAIQMALDWLEEESSHENRSPEITERSAT
jgi:hypothetical protein